MSEEITAWSKFISEYVVPKWVFIVSILVLVTSIILSNFFGHSNLIERSGSIITFLGLLLTNRATLRLRKYGGAYTHEYDEDERSNPYGLLLLAFGTILWGYGGLFTTMIHHVGMISIIGYLAMICLMTASIPQAVKSVKDGHSNGIAGGYLILLLTGFTFMSAYLLLTKPIIPVLVNYASNIVMMLIVGYYKLFPRNKV